MILCNDFNVHVYDTKNNEYEFKAESLTLTDKVVYLKIQFDDYSLYEKFKVKDTYIIKVTNLEETYIYTNQKYTLEGKNLYFYYKYDFPQTLELSFYIVSNNLTE